MLLIESGSRSLIENVLPHLRRQLGADVEIDLVTCYAGLPDGYDSRTTVFRVTDYATPERRPGTCPRAESPRLFLAGMICSRRIPS